MGKWWLLTNTRKVVAVQRFEARLVAAATVKLHTLLNLRTNSVNHILWRKCHLALVERRNSSEQMERSQIPYFRVGYNFKTIRMENSG